MGSYCSCIKEKEAVEEPLTEYYREYVNPIGSFRHVQIAPTVRVHGNK
jgi:hypothetical protein